MMVTILTALNDEDLKAIGNNNTVADQVEKLAKVAKEMNVGIVCSGHEAKNCQKNHRTQSFNFYPRDSYELLIIKMIKQRICTPIESIKKWFQ